MSDNAKIKAEIQAKKDRLKALKEKRDARKKNRAGGAGAGAKGGGAGDRKARAEARKKEREEKKRLRDAAKSKKPATDVADLVSSVTETLGPPPEAKAPLVLETSTPPTSLHNIDSIVPEMVDKLIECCIIGGTDDEKKTAELAMELENQKLQLLEEEEKMKILKEQLKRDKLKYDKLKEEERLFEPQELSSLERRRIEDSKNFQTFFSSSSKIIERALNFTIDYNIDDDEAGGDGGDTEKKVAPVVPRATLLDEKKTGSRAVTSIFWSAKFSELLLSSYAGQDDPMSLDPDGTVLIWNMHMPNRPEYSFYCNSAVLTAEFHPSNPKLIVGGCRSGQVVVWDTRAKRTPVDRTSLSRGHTYPVYALRCLPVVNNNNLISVSTDGLLCQWNDASLAQPSNEIDLHATRLETEGKESAGAEEITTTSFDFPGRETSSIILGSDEGKVYKARIYDQKGIWYTIDAHDAPITNVQFHPTQKNSPTNVSDLFLTSSYDWTVKLWSNKTNRALYTFESARDYVFDCQWSPVHPSVFASGDGSGKLDLWNLVETTEVPIHSHQMDDKNGAVSRIKWSDDGTNLAVGMSTGAVHVFDVKDQLVNASSDESNRFYAKMAAETIAV